MRKKDGRRNVTQCSVDNFKELPFFSFACSTPAGLVFLLFIFLSQLFHFIHQILQSVKRPSHGKLKHKNSQQTIGNPGSLCVTRDIT